jgi:hypothetical protein
MVSDRVLLKTIKDEFWFFMNKDEQKAWNNYWLLITTKNYELSKKNLVKLERIVSNIQLRRQQAKLEAFNNDLFE